MSRNYEIDQFGQEDIEPVTNLWKILFKNHILSAKSLWQYTLLRSDFDPAGSFVARQNGQLIGVIMATVMRIPETGSGELPGCIPVIMVRPEHQKKGIGRALLEKGEGYLRARGKERARAGYPTYIRGTILSLMGVDAQWKESFWFFRHHDYKLVEIMDSAKVDLEGFQVPERILEIERRARRQGIEVGVLTEQKQGEFLGFLKEAFSGWHREFAERIRQRQVVLDNVLVLTQAGQIVGFAGPFDIPESRAAALGIGIGLKEQLRGRGLGNIILFRSLAMIRDKAGRECYIFGVGPKRYYEHAGFKMAELWIIMEKDLR